MIRRCMSLLKIPTLVVQGENMHMRYSMAAE